MMKSSEQELDYGPLFRLAGEMGREADLSGLLLMILEKSRPWIQAEACSIFLPEDGSGELVIHSAQGDSVPQLGTLRVPKGKGIVGSAMEERKVIRVDDVSKDSRFYAKADEKTGWKTKALLAAPLLDGAECVGVIEFLNPIGRAAFTSRDETMVEYFAGVVAAWSPICIVLTVVRLPFTHGVVTGWIAMGDCKIPRNGEPGWSSCAR